MKESTLIKAPRAAAAPPHELQGYGTVNPMPVALDTTARQESTNNLNQLLADTITLRDLYRKHH